MKKVLLILLSLSINSFGYTIHVMNKYEFKGKCRSGEIFSGVVNNRGHYTVTASLGSGYGYGRSSFSRDAAIRKACKE